MTNLITPPGETPVWLPKRAVDRLVVGPHSILTRNGLTFNDRSQPDAYIVEDFTGFEKPEGQLNEEANTAEDGAVPYPSFYGGRTMTLTGFIRTGSYPRLLEMTGALEDSLIDLIESPLTIGVNPDSPWFTHPDVSINCRPSDFQIDRKLTQEDQTGVFKRSFTVALRATNPRYLSTVQKSITIQPIFITQLGRSYDRTYDLAYTTYMNAAGDPVSLGNNQEVVDNAGNWPALPVIRFNGPMDGITLVNEANDQMVRLTGLVSANDWIEVDVARGKVYDLAGNNRFPSFDTTSDWMRLPGKRLPLTTGDSPISLGVTSFDGDSSVVVTWSDTWISA